MEIIEEVQNEKAPGHALVRIDNIEGDWQAYVRLLGTIDTTKASRPESLAAKRKCALAYLGKRAQSQGGIYSKSTPRILTPQFILLLQAENCTQRFKRYPWLERLVKLWAEIESMQDEITLKSKVLPLFSRTP